MVSLLQAGLMQGIQGLSSGGLTTAIYALALVFPLLYKLWKTYKEGYNEEKTKIETVAIVALLALMRFIDIPVTSGIVGFIVNLIPWMALGYFIAVAFLWFTSGKVAEIMKVIE